MGQLVCSYLISFFSPQLHEKRKSNEKICALFEVHFPVSIILFYLKVKNTVQRRYDQPVVYITNVVGRLYWFPVPNIAAVPVCTFGNGSRTGETCHTRTEGSWAVRPQLEQEPSLLHMEDEPAVRVFNALHVHTILHTEHTWTNDRSAVL